jgi:hypothetical protein
MSPAPSCRSSHRIEISYDDGKRFRPLPSWCEFFMRLGEMGASWQRSDAKLRIAVVVPTRAFAAAFVAVGAVIATCVEPIDRSDRKQYLDWLCANKIGSRARLRVGDSWRAAELINCTEELGQLRLCCKVLRRKGHDYSKLSGPSLDRLAGISETLSLLDVPSRSAFLTGWSRSRLSETAAEFSLRAEYPPLIIGSRRKLIRESNTSFLVSIDGAISDTGNLQDILAIENSNSRDPVRCRVLAPSSEVSENLQDSRFVIFDGSDGFIEHRRSFSKANYLVVLDRSDSRFNEGLMEFQSDYALSASDDLSSIKGLPTPPPGVELGAYVESRA